MSEREREELLLMVQQLDLENLELKKKLSRHARLEMAVRTAAQLDPAARELLKALGEAA